MKKLLLSITFLLLISGPALPDSSTSNLPDGFVDVKEVIPSIILDMRYYTSHNFIGKKIDGYHAGKCILTKEAAQALKGVQDELRRSSLSLKLYDCYRPQRAVNHFARWAKDISDTKMKKEFYPTMDKRNLFKDGFIAYKSGHTRGSTVDLTIVPIPVPGQEEYRPGQELRECYLPAEKRFKDNSIDMGTGFDCLHEMSYTESPLIGVKELANRQLLKNIMMKYGFKNYSKEWWHFSLKNEPFPKTYFDFAIE